MADFVAKSSFFSLVENFRVIAELFKK